MQATARIILMVMCGTPLAAVAQDSIDFDRYDADGDGYLVESEWRDVTESNKTFDLVDTNRDGRLDKAEVDAAIATEQESGRNISGQQSDDAMDSRNEAEGNDSPVTSERISAPESQQRNVGLYDTDQDGRVSRSEAQKDGELVTYFVIWDTNQDGYLDQNELDSGSRQTGRTDVDYDRTHIQDEADKRSLDDSRYDNDGADDSGDR